MCESMLCVPQDQDGSDIPGWGGKDQEDWWGRGFLNWSSRQSRGGKDEAEGRSLPAVWRGGQDCTGPRGPPQGKFWKCAQQKRSWVYSSRLEEPSRGNIRRRYYTFADRFQGGSTSIQDQRDRHPQWERWPGDRRGEPPSGWTSGFCQCAHGCGFVKGNNVFWVLREMCIKGQWSERRMLCLNSSRCCRRWPKGWVLHLNLCCMHSDRL